MTRKPLTEEQREKARIAQRRFYANNKEKVAAWNMKWRADNKTRYAEMHREWRKKHRKIAVERVQRHSRKKYPEPTRPEPVVCECCGNPDKNRALALDHCHVTNKFRGWLCKKCNLSIGHLGDNSAGVKLALDYLLRSENG